jgi:hypothetical protein
MVAESDDIAASVDDNGEGTCDIRHPEIHGFVSGNVGVGTICFGVFGLGLCALYAEEWLVAQLEVGEVLASELLNNRICCMSQATMPELELGGRLLGDLVYHCKHVQGLNIPTKI